DEQYDWLHNHELAHEWWGNLVTCRDWKDMWIHEGFGTYMQPLYKEIRFGRQAYQREMVRQRTIDRAAIAPREVKTSQQIYFGPGGSNDIYNKGSWVLHTLRYELGDEKFFTLLRRFCYPTPALEKATDGSQCRLVDTDDFVAMCSEVAGEDMAWFFEVYVRQPHLPTLSASLDDGLLKIRWTTPGDLPFHLDVPVILGGKEVRVPMTGGHGELRVGDREYRVDPDRRVLAKRGEGLK
ncbi:MAG: M1 family peptidase, partial [Planctomycetes bacterium]|nr:M1 family peptidase [Planctomycetota bacterium]